MERNRSSLNERVQCELERLILRGVLKPGDHIKEQALADRLGVSRSPIREACRALERAGLVETIPHRGVFVRRVDLHDATDVFDIRAELAGIVARQAVHNVSPKWARVLAELIERMDEAAARKDADAYLDLNLEFHATLYGLADNRRVALLDRALGNELLVYRRRGLASGGGLEVSNRDHRRMLALLVEGKADELEQLIRQHILDGKHRFLIAIGAAAHESAAPPGGTHSHHPMTRTAQ